MANTLYIVPTPIGNLEDITLRALRILADVDLIAAEDTRTTGRLLTHYEIDTPQIAYHEHNKLARLHHVLDALATGDVALVSDAGTPGLSDPGYELIRAAIEDGATVTPLPGPTAVIPALVASGLPTDAFTYGGFLPRKQKARREALAAFANLPHTLVLYEAPHRLLDALSDIQHTLGKRQVVVARELTKLHEELWRGPVDEAIVYYTEQSPRGEITLLIEGAVPPEEREWTTDEVRALFAEQLAADKSRSAAARAVAKLTGWPKSQVYDMDVS